ncbi:MAG TPA: DUF4153 domain-containing protein [Actinomycetes bacterium]
MKTVLVVEDEAPIAAAVAARLRSEGFRVEVANVSHELRTPISALQAELENLVDGIEPADPETLRTMLRQAERLGRLVAQLLDLSRLESGAVPLQRRVFQVGPLLEDAAAEARLAAPGITVAVRAEPGLAVDGDPERVHQVLANLVSNATRYSPAGGTVELGARRPLGALEAMVVLGGLCALFASFAAAQVVALSGGARHVLDTAGLTYAQYARSGFFQLLAVAVITLGVLLALRAVTELATPRRRLAFTVLAELAVALTLVIVVVAIRRLNLYEDAYGLTMLRLYSELFSYWIGVVFLLLGASVAGLGRARAWLLGAAAGAGLVLLLALNLANPEAVVARDLLATTHERQRPDTDTGYLVADLGDDAAPAIVAGTAGLDPELRAELLAPLCRRHLGPPRHRGWAAWNLGAAHAREALAGPCGT